MAEVPERFYGCHTLAVDGYTVEGLVPIETITKLLTEKPKIRGISLPGMPVGAPGMPGRTNAPLIVYEIPQGAAAPKEFSRVSLPMKRSPSQSYMFEGLADMV